MGKLQHVLGPACGHEAVVNLGRHHAGAQRLCAIGHLFGDVHDVGHHAKGFGCCHGAQTAKTGDDLIKNQQDAVLGTDFAQALQIACRRNHHTPRSGHGLHNHGGDIAGVMQRNQVQQALG